MIMTSSGKLTRFTVSEIGVIGRLTQGVRLMNVEQSEKVCVTCHNEKSPTYKAFDYAARLAEVAHPNPSKSK